MQMWNVKLNLSTADHPQTDGQSENLIKTLSNMIRSVVQKAPKDWDLALPELDFEYNCLQHASTGLSPFEVDIGRVPHRPHTRSLEECTVKCHQAAIDMDRRECLLKIAKDSLATARCNQKYYADKRRRDLTFKTGDLVMLHSKAFEEPNRADLPKKWRPKYLGPLRVKKVMGPVTYKIQMPPSMKKAHNFVHVSKLKPYQREGESDTLDVVIDADGTVEQEVKAILDRRRVNRRYEYLVQFVGQPESEAIYLPRTDVRNCMEFVRDYENTLKSKSGSFVRRGSRT